ncbi:DNA (cytosine-5)-methyltransferase 1 [Tetrabaena socialis]|uniref:DNA (Cytosine-5)-methyltransferase 1 n=1 Tax=Tetrabaena socialis TaxID=47790 RepID=A0A2J7ZT13_9CHLO|nr:DNA (cytosine-5)-methyltransferase 1 [Tetrabaena socialis]|eukprot:PNH03380.1 DNA (cytosine-5)-methyltransferase 1 [Tetrabaena socialis]
MEAHATRSRTSNFLVLPGVRGGAKPKDAAAPPGPLAKGQADAGKGMKRRAEQPVADAGAAGAGPDGAPPATTGAQHKDKAASTAGATTAADPQKAPAAAAGGDEQGGAAAAPTGKKLKSTSAAPKTAPVKAAGQEAADAGGDAGNETAQGAKGKAAAKGGRGSKRAAAELAAQDPEAAAPEADGDDAAEKGAGGGRGRRDAERSRKATQRVTSYKERAENADEDDEMVDVVEEAEVATEVEALQHTAATSVAAATTTRRFADYSLTDGEGRPEPLDRMGGVEGGLFMTGCVYPGGGAEPRGKDAKQLGRRVSRVGPIREWRILYSPTAEPKIVLHTAAAQYECGRATAPYRKLLEPLQAQVDLAAALHKALCPQAPGGRLDASFDDVCCRVARLKVSKQYGGARCTLKLNGRFVLEQLAAMAAAAQPSAAADKGKGSAKGKEAADKGKEVADKSKGAATCSYDNGPFARGLQTAMVSGGRGLLGG